MQSWILLPNTCGPAHIWAGFELLHTLSQFLPLLWQTNIGRCIQIGEMMVCGNHLVADSDAMATDGLSCK